MKYATRKLRPAVKTHGGKTYLARRIIEYFPEHKTYVEPFAGGLSVLLNKPKSEVEVASDLNPALMAFHRKLQGDSAVCGLASELSYDETTFIAAERWLESEDPRCRFLGFLVRNRFSRGGLGKDFAWSDRVRGGQPGDVNGWQTIVADMPLIAARLKGVNLFCSPALAIIAEWDGPDVLIYADPPYLHETRTVTKGAYEHEMGDNPEDSYAKHFKLLSILVSAKSSVVISGYHSDLYDSMLHRWRRVDFDMPNHSGQGASKQRRTECLWIKP